MAKETPTEFLIRSLESIEEAEDVVLIVRRKSTDGKDDVDWFANDVPLWKMLGMVEFAKCSMFETAQEEDE